MSDRQNNDNYAAEHEDYALSPVPESARRGLFSMSAVMLGFTFFRSQYVDWRNLGTGVSSSGLTCLS